MGGFALPDRYNHLVENESNQQREQDLKSGSDPGKFDHYQPTAPSLFFWN
jgi:hypothetical protein